MSFEKCSDEVSQELVSNVGSGIKGRNQKSLIGKNYLKKNSFQLFFSKFPIRQRKLFVKTTNCGCGISAEEFYQVLDQERKEKKFLKIIIKDN